MFILKTYILRQFIFKFFQIILTFIHNKRDFDDKTIN